MRRRLLRSVTTQRPRVVVLTAPAGSGKSVFLSQWTSAEPRPVAWLTCVESHLDPLVLVHDLAAAVSEGMGAGPVSEAANKLHAGDPVRQLTKLVRALAAEPAPGMIVLDDVHRIGAQPRSVDLVVTLVDQLPPGWTVAIAKRQSVGLPLSRWAGFGASFMRIGFADLALDAHECAELLKRVGITSSDELVPVVLDRTEGWPVAVYLTGLSLRSERPLRDERLVVGDDALVRSYLESEILSSMSPTDHALLMETSILREVSGPLARAVTGVADAGERLGALSRSNLLVMPVDRQESVFRYHGLLGDLLRRELEDSGQDTSVLHARAAAWYEHNGDTDLAIRHASLASDDTHVRSLVLATFMDEYGRGHGATVQGWMNIALRGSHGRDGELALAATLLAALQGATATTVHAADAAGLDGADEDPATDSLDRAVIRAFLCTAGPSRMRMDARLALDRHGPTWPWAPLALVSLGSAERMLGDAEASLEAFTAVERVDEGAMALARLMARAERAQAAMDRRSWSDAETLLQLDRHFVVDVLDGARIAGTMWLVTDARLQVHRGDVRTAQERLRLAQLGRVHLTWALPWYAVRTLTEMAHAQLLVGDAAGAVASLEQAREILASRPLLGNLVAELEQMEARARANPDARRGGSTLSRAELRLLPLLQTYLSFKEIGERLSISANTVKTQAVSIYSKLGASTRSEAVELAVAAGLLEDPFA